MRLSVMASLAALMSVTMLIVACKDEDKGGLSSTGGQTVEVRMAHMADVLSSIDVWSDDGKMFSDVAYFDITSYAVAGAGTHNLHISTAGSSPPDYLYSETISLAPGVPATIAVANQHWELDVLVYADDRSTDLTQAKLRFIHFVQFPEAVSVDWGENLHVFTSVRYGAATTYRLLEPGMHDMLIRESETDSLVYNCPDIELGARHNYTMFVVGAPGDMGFAMVADG